MGPLAMYLKAGLTVVEDRGEWSLVRKPLHDPDERHDAEDGR